MAKTLILVSIDALLAVGAFWLAASVRLGRVPAMSGEQTVLVTLVVMVLVPFAAYLCGLYRMVNGHHAPWLPLRTGMASALSGAAIFALALLGNGVFADALGLGVAFALILFALLVLGRWAARQLTAAQDKSS